MVLHRRRSADCRGANPAKPALLGTSKMVNRGEPTAPLRIDSRGPSESSGTRLCEKRQPDQFGYSLPLRLGFRPQPRPALVAVSTAPRRKEAANASRIPGTN